MPKVLIIDDEDKLRKLLARIISLEGYDVLESSTAKDGLKKLEDNNIDVILCDVKLPDGDGVDIVKQIKRISTISEIILLTAYGNLPDGVQAIKNGAFDYITKGNDNDKIIPLLNSALEKVQLQKRVAQLERKVAKKYSFDNIIGSSNLIKQSIELAKKVSPSDTTVLLSGETGTGKEIFAQSIHQLSGRKLKQFVAINCSAISRDILESELFGYKSGAFTGAVRDKKGLLEEANGGTFFLDEIGEMPMELQAKLLRVLETNEFIRLGDTKTQKVNIRYIAATNRDLKKEIQAGKFRRDLFYRLSVFQISLPSLQDRIKDIALLANHFLEIYNAKTNKNITAIDDKVIHLLMQYNYPGNIRELKNIIERAVILEEGSILTLNSLPAEMQNIYPSVDESSQLSAFDLASAEKLHIQKVLNYTGGNKTETARLLHIGLTTLYRKMDEYNISS